MGWNDAAEAKALNDSLFTDRITLLDGTGLMNYDQMNIESIVACFERVRAEQRDKDADISDEHDCKTHSECCDCRSIIAQAIRAGDERR